MINQKDRKFFVLEDNKKNLSNSANNWLAQYDEEDDFLTRRSPNVFPDFTEEKIYPDIEAHT